MKTKVFAIRCGFLLLSLALFKSQAAVNPGDIAVIGLNCDPSSSLSKTFAIVALADIGAGEVIIFSDKLYYANAFAGLLSNGTEGRFSWTTPAGGVSKGTMIMFTVTSSSSAPSVTTSPATGTTTVVEGWTNTTATASPFSLNGDNILIYQGTEASPNFIFGFNSGSNTTGISNGWNTGLSSNTNNACELPATLTNGTNAIGLGGSMHHDNYKYNGTRSGSKTALLAAICNTSNWVYAADEATAWNLTPGGAEFTGSQPIFTILTSTMPVQLTSFSGSLSGNEHLLQWNVASETDFAIYTIEHSSDGQEFKPIGFVKANGSPHYSFLNMAPATDKSYYRLKMVDIDGKFTYSAVIIIKNAFPSYRFILSPNPSRNLVNISAGYPIQEIVIINAAGQPVMNIKMNNSQTASLSTGPLAAGNYFIRVKTSHGIINSKWVKQ